MCQTWIKGFITEERRYGSRVDRTKHGGGDSASRESTIGYTKDGSFAAPLGGATRTACRPSSSAGWHSTRLTKSGNAMGNSGFQAYRRQHGLKFFHVTFLYVTTLPINRHKEKQ